MKLREAINDYCKQCTHDPCSPGTWKQQITLCSAYSCPLHNVRPQSTSSIPDSVLSWYEVDAQHRQEFKRTYR